jgi:hypothetical protein
VVPIYNFFVLTRKLSVYLASAKAATYSLVRAVNFVAVSAFLEAQNIEAGGHMVARVGLMESPASFNCCILMMRYDEVRTSGERISLKSIIHHSFTNGSVLTILGSLLIGLIAKHQTGERHKAIDNRYFQMISRYISVGNGNGNSRKILKVSKEWMVCIGLFNHSSCDKRSVAAHGSPLVTLDAGNRFIFAILAASASYITLPAAMRLAVH